MFCSLHKCKTNENEKLNRISLRFATFQLIGFNHDTVLKQFIPSLASNAVPATQAINIGHFEQRTNTDIENRIPTKSAPIADDSQILHVNVTFAPISSTPPTKSEPSELEKGQTLLTSFFKKVERSEKVERVTNVSSAAEIATDAQFNDTTDISEYLPDPLDESDDDNKSGIDEHCERSPCLLRLRNQINRKYRRFAKQKYLLRSKIVKNLVFIVKAARHTFANNWNRFRSNACIQFVYKCIVSFHHLITVLIEQQQISETAMQNVNVNVNEKMTSTESIMINRRVQRLLHDKDQLADDIAHNVGGTNAPATDSMNKRLPKNQRANESTKLLLSENVQDSSEKDFRE